MTLSEELKKVYASVGADVVLPTLAISHPAISTLYLVRNYTSFTADLETGAEVTFLAYAFNIVPPKKSDTGNESLTITIDNVDKNVYETLKQVLSQPEFPLIVDYRIYLASDTSGPQNTPPQRFYVRGANITLTSAVLQAETSQVLDKSFPSVKYRPGNFKSLRYVT